MSRFWRLVFRHSTVWEETFEIDQAWVLYCYFVPNWIVWLLGLSCIRMECIICGVRYHPTFRLKRWGPMEDRGRHPKRVRFCEQHLHPHLNKNPLCWELPLKNPAALPDGGLEEVVELVLDRSRREHERRMLEDEGRSFADLNTRLAAMNQNKGMTDQEIRDVFNPPEE